ncbi:MAG: hypothetical protein JSU92_04790 [Deltaproteobacteria bacterium]|nr:MAG: hypothetical protein JSU92_04790 [Deltaproteobacteria bacterium]
MSHTSQRRGLDPSRPGKEMIVLAMIPGRYKEKGGIRTAMSELALKMLAHRPHNWLTRNFAEITIPQLGAAQGLVGWLNKYWPETTRRLLMRLVAQRSTVVTAIYTEPQNTVNLVKEIKGEWLTTNQQEGYPISIVLSGLFDDIHQCCRDTGVREHTYLHSLGSFGRTGSLPAEDELELITMCGHGLIAPSRVQHLVEKVRKREITPMGAAEDITKPCVCGIANRKRAEEIFGRLSEI